MQETMGRWSQQVANPERNRTLEMLARLGNATKGVVYIIVGGLALMSAWGRGGQVAGSEGAFDVIARQPFGQLLLGVVAVGLAGYAAWRFALAALDPERSGSDGKRIARRVGNVVLGVVHAGLCVAAFQKVTGRSAGGRGEQSWVSSVMDAPLGQLAVGVAGIAVVGFALSQAWSAYKEKFMAKIDTTGMSPQAVQTTRRVGRIGHGARGVVFTIIGAFLVKAAIEHDPSQARGLGGALRELAAQPYGVALLAVVAFGLTLYGVYQLMTFRHRRLARS